MSGRYSHNAYDHAMRDVKREDRQAVGEVLDAAHDREMLGLDASVCARVQLDEIVQAALECPDVRPRDAGAMASYLRRTFGDRPCGQQP